MHPRERTSSTTDLEEKAISVSVRGLGPALDVVDEQSNQELADNTLS
jgi:hypothetical protein